MALAQIRRSSDPLVVQQLYDAINSIRKQRQIANLKRILRIMERDHGYSKKDILHSIHKAVTDELIVETLTVGTKGMKTGVEQEGYWICDKDKLVDEISKEKNDWYCFNCHTSGKVISCASCFRVYHPDCVELDVCTIKKEIWNCSYCVAKANRCNLNESDKNALGRCLHCIVGRQKGEHEELCSKPDEEIAPYYDMFVFTHYDLNMLYVDCGKGKFATSTEFESKIKVIQHNFLLMFGADHSLSRSASKLVETCKGELKELKLCENCFYLSNTKPMNDWFCKPCRPPHQVVWAKQKGFDFWPAKIIRVEDDRIDVRFFGRYHPRAWITVDGVKSISVSPCELKVKRKQQWKQACNEMNEYIRQCECGLGKEEASKVVLFNSPYGIGKNNVFAKKCVEMNLNTSKSKETPLKEYVDLNKREITPEKILTPDELPPTPSPTSQKRQSVGDNKKISSKLIKLEAEDDMESSDQINDSGSQTYDQEATTCGCNTKHIVLFNEFKQYIIESSKLEEQKIMRQLQTVYNEKVRILEEKHRSEISDIKKKHWCFGCEKRLTHHRLKARYCSTICENKYKITTED